MTPSRTIYIIRQSPALLKAWRELSAEQKRAVVAACETEAEDENEVARIIEEIVRGQRRFF